MVSGYGMTELGATHISTRLVSKEGTVGKLLPLTELRVGETKYKFITF